MGSTRMIEQVTRLLMGGTLSIGVAMLASAVAPVVAQMAGGGDSSATIKQVAASKPELAAILIALSMFLGYLALMMRDRKEDRKAANEAQEKCHDYGREMHDKTAQLTTACMVKLEEVSGDRDALAKVVEENTKSNNELRTALRQGGTT